jgi:hypothetical protein
MDTHDSVEAYRTRLLDSLRVQPSRDHDEEPGSLQIFVNHECVGIMECDQAGHAVASITQARAIQTVEIRTACGRLIGSLCAQDLRMKMARLPVGDHVIEISIHNRVDGGSVQVAYHAATPEAQPARAILKDGHAKTTTASALPSRPWFPQSVRSHAAMAGRAGFAIAVLFLVVDRLADRAGSPPPEPMETRAASSSQDSAMSQKALARQEEVLVRVMQGQEAATRTMQAEQQVLARAHQAIEGLAQGQYQLTDRVGRMLIQMAKLDEDARAGMEVRTKTDRGIKQATVTLAQTMPPDLSNTIPAKAGELTTLSPGPFSGIADGSRDLPPLASFTFRVSFHDNTPEKSIQDLIQQIHGRTGQVNEGWYSIEVDLPQSQTPDLFVDALKKAKIVKSVATSLQTTSVR